MEYKTEDLRSTVSKEEAIRRISTLGGEYDPDSLTFDLYDQLHICISEAFAKPVDPNDHDGKLILQLRERYEEYLRGNGSVNSGSKHRVNFELTPTQLKAIEQLRSFDHRTIPPLIAEQLKVLFEGSNTVEGWWLVVAQRWNPRAINRTIDEWVRLQKHGWKTLGNPAAYFTFLMKNRKERRSSRRSINS